MRAWVAQSPTDPVKLKTIPSPILTKPDQVLIKVKAASVNPVDTLMVKGYGKEVLGTWKRLEAFDFAADRFPLVPGRDCAGVVEAVGPAVKGLKPGDEAASVNPVDTLMVKGYGKEVLGTWKRLEAFDFAADRFPLVPGRDCAGVVEAVGPAVKGLKPGDEDIEFCSAYFLLTSNLSAEMVRKLGAIPVDYRAEDAKDRLIEEGPFEVIFDCVDSDLAKWSDKIMPAWRNSVHVSVVAPLLKETDRHGLLPGMATTAVKHFFRSYESALHGRWFSYAFFAPSQECMLQLSRFAEEGKIKPIVERVQPFEELPTAYEKVEQLHNHGKTVLTW
ncbi:GroES-like protein [Teladorsagia circumcincta]|uniref:GroES-like protein n=1 Tax=Teladorsagia circumcincta TaxID=45464 RepID=A0A2G9U7E2_TELCI|nr:GroES-like protein [Teladorsagia circumcincta]